MKAKGLICKSIMVVLFMLCTNDAINAQIKIDGFAINPKLGACKTEYEAFIFGGEFNVTLKRTIYSVDYYRTFQVMNPERLKMIDFMVGKYYGGKIFRLQFQGGLGTLSGKKVNEKKNISEEISTFGVPLKLGFKILVTNSLSLGIDLQAHLNSRQAIEEEMKGNTK